MRSIWVFPFNAFHDAPPKTGNLKILKFKNGPRRPYLVYQGEFIPLETTNIGYYVNFIQWLPFYAKTVMVCAMVEIWSAAAGY